jgi:hypothetical protein
MKADYIKYACKEFFNFIDRFRALHFTVTGAPLALRSIQILLMNQHASWPIMFGMWGSN